MFVICVLCGLSVFLLVVFLCGLVLFVLWLFDGLCLRIVVLISCDLVVCWVVGLVVC